MSINNVTSETALVTASLRALSNYEDDNKVNCNDNLAVIFLTDDRKNCLCDKNSRETIKGSIPKGLYEYVIARTKYFDGVVIEALKNNFGQIVFLGAGYDSRPYRFKNLIKNTKIFEIDTKPTQERKLSLLAANGIEVGENISHISINFETEDFFGLVVNRGFDKCEQTLFIWEGVTFYLSHNAVLHMLKEVKENSAPGSSLCFDFQTIQNTNDLINTGLKDETIKFGIQSGTIEDFVKDNGYTIIEHISSTIMESRYLVLENGDLFGKIMPVMNFLLIEHS